MRRLPFPSPRPESRRVYPEHRGAGATTEGLALSLEGPRPFLRLPSTQNHSLALTQEGLDFPIFSRHSPLVTRHCSSSPLPNSFISPSYSDSPVSPLFPLDTKIVGGGVPKSGATSARSLKVFKNFQANPFPSTIFSFFEGQGGMHTAETCCYWLGGWGAT
jgi:hypothetical protein